MTGQKQVARTRKAFQNLGYEVEVTHERQLTHPPLTMDQVAATTSPRGGKTTVEVLDKDHNVVASGVAVCSGKDNYNKRIGVAIAMGRLVQYLDWYNGKLYQALTEEINKVIEQESQPEMVEEQLTTS